MSTRCTINFNSDRSIIAKIYRHGDGYPESVLPDLQRFFDAVKEQCAGTMYGTRFDDPSYLAAKFVVWQAGVNGNRIAPLDFGSLGVCLYDPSDIDYTYVVDCESHDVNGLPVVTHRKC